MTQVDFYILKPSYPKNLHQFACQLLEKIYNQQLRAYVCTENEQETKFFDQLLWTFRAGSFIPHGLLGEADPVMTPILLGYGQHCDAAHEVLLNLSSTIPEFFNLYQRIVEIVDQAPQRLQQSRERYRRYRDLGYTLKTHEITQ
jgi:DNA polymerase-3 subunit chi